MSAASQTRSRDSARSREAILEAAERIFAENGYEGASLGEVAAAAGLSRGTPSYFFGSKEQLYVAVLDRAFAERQIVMAEAVRPLREWAEHGTDLDGLRRALRTAAGEYLRFLLARPNFAPLMLREELGGGSRLDLRSQLSTALEDAFGTLRRNAKRHGLSAFKVSDAVFVFLSQTFTAVALSHTLMPALDRDVSRQPAAREHVRLVVDQLMHLLTA